MKHVRLVTGTKNIRLQINNQIDFWNSVAFKEIVNDSYTESTVYLGISRETQNTEQRHRTFLNVFSCGKFREAYGFFCKQESKGVFLP